MAKKSEPKESKTPKKETNSKSQSLLVTWVLILVAIQIVISLALFYSISGGSSDSAKIESIEEKVSAMDQFFESNVDGYRNGNGGSGSGNQQAGSGNQERITTEIDLVGEPFLGAEDAPVVLVEFSDYECPFCARFFSDSYGQIKREYVDTGKVKIVFKDFPLGFHQLAEPASVAANCVQEQLGNEKYFEFHDKIFSNQNLLSIDNLKTWAEELGVDSAKFETCTQSTEQINEVRGDLAEGANLGVSGTPTLFINDIKLVGAQPYPVIKEAIESELNS